MADDEKEIRGLLETWARAVHEGDLDTVLDAHADGIVMFDVPPPHQGIRGLDAYREAWPPNFRVAAPGRSVRDRVARCHGRRGRRLRARAAALRNRGGVRRRAGAPAAADRRPPQGRRPLGRHPRAPLLRAELSARS